MADEYNDKELIDIIQDDKAGYDDYDFEIWMSYKTLYTYV
jgi:hypothetical protein